MISFTKTKHVGWVADHGLCHGCGACDIACPYEAIDMVNNGKINFPLINANCTDCSLCNDVCSGQVLETADHFLPSEKENYYLIEASESKLNELGSSGGFITAYLLELLESNLIDGAIVAFSDGTMIGTKAILAKTKEEIISSIGSKYYPISSCEPLKLIEKNKKYAFVGKGCDLDSLVLLENNIGKIKNAIYIKIGLMCHHTPFASATKALIENQKISPAAKANITFRGEGWPGQTIISNKKKSVKLDYKISWGEWLGKSENMPFRCKVCTSSFAPNADIIVGDPWVYNPNLENRQKGISLIITNSKNALKEIERIRMDKQFQIEKTNFNIFLKSQKGLIEKYNASTKRISVMNYIFKNQLSLNNFKTKQLSLKDKLSGLKFTYNYWKKYV